MLFSVCARASVFFGVQSVIVAIYNANNIVKWLIFSLFATIRLVKFVSFLLYCCCEKYSLSHQH